MNENQLTTNGRVAQVYCKHVLIEFQNRNCHLFLDNCLKRCEESTILNRLYNFLLNEIFVSTNGHCNF